MIIRGKWKVGLNECEELGCKCLKKNRKINRNDTKQAKTEQRLKGTLDEGRGELDERRGVEQGMVYSRLYRTSYSISYLSVRGEGRVDDSGEEERSR